MSRAQLNELWQHYLRAVREVRPKAFVIENVPQFQRSAQFAKLLQLLDEDPDFREYKYAYGVLNAAAGVLTVPLILAVVGSARRTKVQEPVR